MKIKLLGLALLGTAAAIQPALADEALAKIKNIVVIYAENRSFDHLFGFFPGANGIDKATAEQKTQLDHDGAALPALTIFERRKARSALPAAAERAVPHRYAADRRAARHDRA